MNPVSSLFKKDTRFNDEAKSAFPQSPVVGCYLAERLKKTNGSLTVLRVLIEELKDAVKDPSPVTVDDYARLCVDENGGHVVRLAKALRIGGIDTAGRSLVLMSRLGKPVPSDATDVKSCKMNPDPEVDVDYLEDYLRIFVCAMAMLDGVKIDPREAAA